MEKSLGMVIKEARQSLALSQTQIGKAVGVSKQSVSQYEKDQFKPSRQVLKKICDLLDLNFQEQIKEFYDFPKVCEKFCKLPDKEVIGNTYDIRARRIEMGLLQKHAAEKCGVSQSYFSGIEKGKVKPGLKLLRRICDVFGWDFQEVLKGFYDLSDNATIGKIIKSKRLALGLYQYEVAEQCKIAIKCFNQIENDKAKPRGKVLKKICDVLELDFYLS